MSQVVDRENINLSETIFYYQNTIASERERSTPADEKDLTFVDIGCQAGSQRAGENPFQAVQQEQ